MSGQRSTDDLPSLDQLVALAADLAEADDRMRAALIRARKAAGLTQADVAESLGIKQSSVASFERHDNDPRLSTIRRYALAVGARIEHRVMVNQASDEGSLVASRDPDDKARGAPTVTVTEAFVLDALSKAEVIDHLREAVGAPPSDDFILGVGDTVPRRTLVTILDAMRAVGGRTGRDWTAFFPSSPEATTETAPILGRIGPPRGAERSMAEVWAEIVQLAEPGGADEVRRLGPGSTISRKALQAILVAVLSIREEPEAFDYFLVEFRTLSQSQ